MSAPQISDSELELMKIIWSAGGTALYAQIMETLAEEGRSWQKNTVITLLSRLVAFSPSASWDGGTSTPPPCPRRSTRPPRPRCW